MDCCNIKGNLFIEIGWNLLYGVIVWVFVGLWRIVVGKRIFSWLLLCMMKGLYSWLGNVSMLNVIIVFLKMISKLIVDVWFLVICFFLFLM